MLHRKISIPIKNEYANQIKQSARNVVQLLKFLNPKLCSNLLINKIVAIFFSIDVRLYHMLIKWYEARYNSEQARQLIWKTIKSAEIPLVFQITPENGLCLAMIEASQTVIEDALIPEKLVTVPSIKGDGSFRRYVPAVIRLGDFVLMRGLRENWYIVHELNADRHSIILRRASDSDIDESAAFTTRTARNLETREVSPLFFLGAAIRRKIWSDEFNSMEEYYFSIPGSSIDAAVKEMHSLVTAHQREISFSGADVESDMPQSDWSNGQVGDSSQPRRRNAAGNTHGYLQDPIREMQCKAVIKVWLQRKEELAAIKKLFVGSGPERIDSSCAENRDWWLMICRALKTLCRGDRELLPVFENWTDQCTGDAGKERAQQCGRAWDACRPDTNCDTDILARARIFCRNNNVEPKDVSFDAQTGKFLIEYSRLTPQICSVLDSVETMINADATLMFLSYEPVEPEPDGDSTNNELVSSSNLEARPVLVPVVNYEVDIARNQFDEPVEVHTSAMKWFTDREKNEVDEIGGLHKSIGRFVGSEHAPASIRVGDVLMVRLASFLKHLPDRRDSSSIVDGDTEGSYQVLRVDLLFARIFVQQCDPAPQCWRPKLLAHQQRHQQQQKQEDVPIDCNFFDESFWVPVSCIWGVTVCRPLSTTQHPMRHGDGRSLLLQYSLFLTPVPDMTEMMQFLQTLPKHSAKSPTLTTHASSSASRTSAIAETIIEATSNRTTSMPQVCLSLLNVSVGSIDVSWTISIKNEDAPRSGDSKLGAITMKALNETCNKKNCQIIENEKKKIMKKKADAVSGSTFGSKRDKTVSKSDRKNNKQNPSASAFVNVESFHVVVEVKIDRSDVEYGRIQKSFSTKPTGRSGPGSLPYEWQEIYRGEGAACTVRGLAATTRYTIRTRFVRSLRRVNTSLWTKGAAFPYVDEPETDIDVAHGYVYATTLAHHLEAGPSLVGTWERGSSPGYCRCQMSAVPLEDINSLSLPAGCLISFEGVVMPIPPVEFHDTDNPTVRHLDELLHVHQPWAVLSQSASAVAWIGGKLCGRRLLLRSRVVNQDGLTSLPSAAFTVFDVPDFDAV